MSLAAAALLLAGSAAPSQALEPVDEAYRSAVEARLSGDADKAVQFLEPIVAAQPRNADAQVQFGLAQLARGRLAAAEAAFRAALAVAPDYTDARIGLVRVAQRRGDPARALRELAPVDPANEEAAELRRILGSGEMPTRWQLDLEGSLSNLSGPQPDWREAALGLRYRASDRTTFGGRIEYSRRFGIDDIYGELSAEASLAPGVRAYLSLGATADPDYRPEWQIGVGGSGRLRGGPHATVVTLDARQARFAVGDVQSVTPGIEQYLGGRFWLTGRWINLFDERGTHRSGFLVRGDVVPTDTLRLFAGYSDAPDTYEGVVVKVRSLFGGASLDLNPRTTLRFSVAHENRATGADRTQFTLGVGLRF